MHVKELCYLVSINIGFVWLYTTLDMSGAFVVLSLITRSNIVFMNLSTCCHGGELRSDLYFFVVWLVCLLLLVGIFGWYGLFFVV